MSQSQSASSQAILLKLEERWEAKIQTRLVCVGHRLTQCRWCLGWTLAAAMWMTQTSVPGPRIEMVLSILLWQGYLGSSGHARDCDPWGWERNRLPLRLRRQAVPTGCAPRKARRLGRPGLLQEQQASDRITGPWALVHDTMVEARTNVAAGHGVSCPRR